MAKVVGQSGAYKGVLAALSRVKLSINSLDELAKLQSSIIQFMRTAQANALAEFESEATRLQTRLKEAEEVMQTSLAEGTQKYEQERQIIQSTIDRIQADRNDFGSLLSNLFPLSRLFSWWRLYRQSSKAKEELSHLEGERKKVCKSLTKPVSKQKQELEKYLQGKNSYVKSRVAFIEEQLACVTRLIEKGEAGGAAAELEVIAKLQQLSDEWIVLNDVNLTSDQWHYFQGEHLKTAQLDHVAIGPGGVFIIETKNWSREFVEKGEFHNPYSQIERAKKLCGIILSKQGAPTKIRGIISTRTHMPEKPSNSKSVIKKCEELTNYLLWFDQELTPSEIKRVTSILLSFVAKD